MLALIPGLPPTVVGFEADGKVTAKDYEDLVVPAVESRARRIARRQGQGAVRDPRRRPGLHSRRQLGGRQARPGSHTSVGSDRRGVRRGMAAQALRAFSWMLPGEVQAFALDNLDGALAWITATD